MTLHTTPSAGAMAIFIVAVATISILFATCGIVLRRVALSSFARIAAGTMFFPGVTALGVFSFPLLYPHHHHDTLWIPGAWKWNYPFDAAIGIAYWVAILLLTRGWKRAAGNAKPAV